MQEQSECEALKAHIRRLEDENIQLKWNLLDKQQGTGNEADTAKRAALTREVTSCNKCRVLPNKWKEGTETTYFCEVHAKQALWRKPGGTFKKIN